MDGRSRRGASSWLLVAGFALGLWSCARSPDPVKHGVVLITCDTLRADRLGAYGYPFPTSPNLDRLARESLVFERAFTTAPITGPALSALHTGRMPEELGLNDNRTLLAGEAETLAEVLAARGLETAAVVSNWVLRKRAEVATAGVQQGFAFFDDKMESPEPSRPHLLERSAADTTSAALTWLEQRTSGVPYFLWVHYQDPHGPYTPPADCLAALTREPGDEAPLEKGPNQKGKGSLPGYQVVDDERRPEVYRQRYDAEIRYFDRELGRLLEHLRSSGELERVLLIFTADHGESLGEHGYYFSHGQNLHAELVHVPLFVRPPGGLSDADGRNVWRVAAPASHLDLFPTVLTALGLPGAPTKGMDLLASTLPEGRVLPQYLRGDWAASGARYRLIVAGGTPVLYDLQLDPREEHDLAASRPELVREMTLAHEAFVHLTSGLPLQAVQAGPEDVDRDALRALGYAGDDEPRH